MKNKNNALNLLLSKKKYAKALPLIRKLNKSPTQRSYHNLNLEALCLFELKKYPQITDVLLSALKLCPTKRDEASVFLNLARSFSARGLVIDEIFYFEKYLEVDDSINSAIPRLRLCKLLMARMDYSLVDHHITPLFSLRKHTVAAQIIYCESAIAQFNKPAAIERLSRLSDEKDNLKSHDVAFILHSLIKMNEFDHAMKIYQLFNVRFSADSWLKFFDALFELNDKNYHKVISILEGVDVKTLPSWFVDLDFIYSTLANAYDKTGLFNEAFCNYQAMSDTLSARYKSFNRIDILPDYKKIDLGRLSSAPYTDSRKQPVFMLGFPRSGSTLLETILDTHPLIKSISEPRTITTVFANIPIKGPSGSYVSELSDLSEEQIVRCREIYFKQVEQLVGEDDRDKLLIDKLPMYSIHLPLINILFPQAKFIINLRHPLDVILSNFQQNYNINNDMAFLISLKDCVKRYVDVFNFVNDAESALKLDSINIKYEDLLNDLQGECFRLFDFLEVTHNDNFMLFHEHAKNKIINTTSNSQVVQPLYNSSKFKWLNYKEHLIEFIPSVEEVAKRYGYIF